MKRCIYVLSKLLFLVQIIFFTTCIDPVEPEFNFITGLVTIEGVISNQEGLSFVKIQESDLNPAYQTETYINIPINGAQVTFINLETLEEINLVEDIENEVYLPPSGFAVSVANVWELDIVLQDGRHYKSLPETILKPVDITAIEATYNTELEFFVGRNTFVPGHAISISFDDPAEDKNYYYWSFRSFEPKTHCLTCYDSLYRDGICNDFGIYPEIVGVPPLEELDHFFYTYLCEVLCWSIRYNQSIEILDDEFVNGATITKLPVANILLYNKKDILVEITQSSISQSAYKYYKTLKDIVDNTGSLNAPPPATLLGNLYNVDDSEDYVLGRFTATTASKASIFINRSAIQDGILEPTLETLNPETEENIKTPPGLPLVLYSPCDEGFYTTSIKPEGWPY